VQYISDLHSKFALRPHHVCKYGRHPVCDHWAEARKKRRWKKKKPQDKNIMACPIPYACHKKHLSMAWLGRIQRNTGLTLIIAQVDIWLDLVSWPVTGRVVCWAAS